MGAIAATLGWQRTRYVRSAGSTGGICRLTEQHLTLSDNQSHEMTRQDIEAILAFGETQTVEFKAPNVDPTNLSKLIGAFANTQGGQIIIGIEGPNTIIGCDPDAVTKSLDRAKKLVTPSPSTSLTFFDFEDKKLGIISVESSPTLLFAVGGVYNRVGDSTQLMGAEWISKRIISNTDSLNLESTIKLLSGQIAAQSKSIESLLTELQQSGSFKTKLKDYIVGGIIGAILGFLPTYFLGK